MALQHGPQAMGGIEGTNAALRAATEYNEMMQRARMNSENNLHASLGNLNDTVSRFGMQHLAQVHDALMQKQQQDWSDAHQEQAHQNAINEWTFQTTGMTPDELTQLSLTTGRSPSTLRRNLAAQLAKQRAIAQALAYGRMIEEAPLPASGEDRDGQASRPAPAPGATTTPVPGGTVPPQDPRINPMREGAAIPGPSGVGEQGGAPPNLPVGLAAALDDELDKYAAGRMREVWMDQNTIWAMSPSDHKRILDVTNEISRIRNSPDLTEQQKDDGIAYYENELRRIQPARLPKPQQGPSPAEQIGQRMVPADSLPQFQNNPNMRGYVATLNPQTGEVKLHNTNPKPNPAAQKPPDPKKVSGLIPFEAANSEMRTKWNDQMVHDKDYTGPRDVQSYAISRGLVAQPPTTEEGIKAVAQHFLTGGDYDSGVKALMANGYSETRAKVVAHQAMELAKQLVVARQAAQQQQAAVQAQQQQAGPTIDDLTRGLLNGTKPADMLDTLIKQGVNPQQADSAIQEAMERASVVAQQAEAAQQGQPTDQTSPSPDKSALRPSGETAPSAGPEGKHPGHHEPGLPGRTSPVYAPSPDKSGLRPSPDKSGPRPSGETAPSAGPEGQLPGRHEPGLPGEGQLPGHHKPPSTAAAAGAGGGMEDLVKHLLSGGSPQDAAKFLVSRGMNPNRAVAVVRVAIQKAAAVQKVAHRQQAMSWVGQVRKWYRKIKDAPMDVQRQYARIRPLLVGQSC